MPRGPLPKPGARRRNQPTIAATILPAAGRPGRAPTSPRKLGPSGRKWWRWAWSTPQATLWERSYGLYAVASRAQLEDDLAAIDAGSSRVAVVRAISDLDKRLGLDPKALAELRWVIADHVEEPEAAAVAPPRAERQLRAV